MSLTAPETRGELKLNLETLVDPEERKLSTNQCAELCEFFIDDLAYDAPYTEMVGAVLYPNELQAFGALMCTLEDICKRIDQVEELDSIVGNLASDLFHIMNSNDV